MGLGLDLRTTGLAQNPGQVGPLPDPALARNSIERIRNVTDFTLSFRACCSCQGISSSSGTSGFEMQKNRRSGVNVMITIFGDFHQFSAKMAVWLKIKDEVFHWCTYLI
jgi:hypothetical protein